MIGVHSSAATLTAAVLVVFAAALLSNAAPAQAQQMYRWTDEKGGVHITDTPPPASAKGVQKQKAAGAPGDADAAPAVATDSFELAQAMKDYPVTLYTAPGCKSACSQARDALNRRSVPFKEVQVWENEVRAELSKLAGTTDVPVLLVGRSVQKGFNQEAFDLLLDSARYPRAGLLPPRKQAAPKPPDDYVEQQERRVREAEPVKPEAEEAKPLGPYAPRFSK